MIQRLTLGAVVGLLLLFVALPLGVLLTKAVDPAAWSSLADPVNQGAFLNTVVLTLGVVAFTVGLGVPLGWLLGRTDLPRKSFWRTALTVPYVVPPYIGAIAWIQLLNPTNGYINRLLSSAGLPVLDIYSIPGMILVLGFFLVPFVFLGTADALSRIDPALEEVARMSGASPFQVLRDVTIPMALPAIGAGAGFVAAAASASFGVPYLLASGTSSPEWVLTTRIYQALALDPSTGQPIAVVLSLVLLIVGVGLPTVARRIEGRRSFVGVTGKANRAADFSLGKWRGPLEGLLVLYVFVAVVLPLATITTTSFLATFGGALTADNLTLRHWHHVLWERPDTVPSILRSSGLALASGVAAVLTGSLVAWMNLRTRLKGRGLLEWLAKTPYAVPGTVLALGLLLSFSQEVRFIFAERVTVTIALMDTVWLLGIAYCVKYLAFPVGNVGAALKSIDPSLEEAARMSGADWGRAMRDVTFPLLFPAMMASFFLVAMPAFSEITMSILLFGPRTPVVGTVLFNLQAYADPPAAAVLAVVVTVLVLSVNAGVRILSRGRVGL